MRANLNDLIDKAEDPEKMVRQLLEDMEEDLIEVKKAVALAMATEKKLYNDFEDHQKKSEEWQRKAELAIQQGRDDLAKEALSRKKMEQQTADGFKQQWDTQKANVTQLREQLSQEEQDLLVFRIDRDLPWRDVVHAMIESDDPTQMPDDEEVRKLEAALRQRFAEVKKRIRHLAETAGLI